jgi:hypothetical protein
MNSKAAPQLGQVLSVSDSGEPHSGHLSSNKAPHWHFCSFGLTVRPQAGQLRGRNSRKCSPQLGHSALSPSMTGELQTGQQNISPGAT